MNFAQVRACLILNLGYKHEKAVGALEAAFALVRPKRVRMNIFNTLKAQLRSNKAQFGNLLNTVDFLHAPLQHRSKNTIKTVDYSKK
ncbi:hypothetical protein NPIL_285331, partial [Nephila pilipes]